MFYIKFKKTYIISETTRSVIYKNNKYYQLTHTLVLCNQLLR